MNAIAIIIIIIVVMDSSPIIYDVVLVGCGHAHVHVLKMIGMMTTSRPQQPSLREMGIRITLVSSHYHTPYSGMLPGYIAGHYNNKDGSYDSINLNVIQLARFANARFINATVNRITYNGSGSNGGDDGAPVGRGGFIYVTDNRPPIRYDCLSIDIGSAPSSTTAATMFANVCPPTIATEPKYKVDEELSSETSLPPHGYRQHNKEESVIPVKPIADLCQYWDTVVQQYQNYLNDICDLDSTTAVPNVSSTLPYTIAIIGGGAGGVELALSIQYRLLSMTQSLLTSTSGTKTISELLQVMIITRGNTILESSSNRRLIQKFQRILHERNIIVHCNGEVDSVIPVSSQYTSVISSDDDDHRHAINGANNGDDMTTTNRSTKQIVLKRVSPPIIVDVCFSCITGTAASWLSDATPFTTTGRDKGNYLRVNPTYELVHHKGVFASGDCCHMDRHPRPKAGVFAVRAGPILFTNILRNIFRNQRLIHHRPQSTYLSILSTGDKYAVACKGRHICVEGRYAWYIKDYIDRKWMAKYSTDLPDLESMMKDQQQRVRRKYLFHWPSLWKRPIPTSNQWTQLHHKSPDAVEAFQENPMRCGGCGSKVGATIVSRVLRNVHDRQVVRAKELGYSNEPSPIDHDDAAITFIPKARGIGNNDNGGALIQTIDYFREMISDPYIFGKVVAVHALSDIHAMGVRAQSALVLAVVPFAADDNITESTLVHLLSGVSDVLQDEDTVLVGGHTCEGIDLACGLSIQSYTDHPTTLWRKRGGQIGDHIILTKPIGTGALFAAEMRAMASGDHIAEAIKSMLESNYRASCAAREFCNRYDKERNTVVHACTDVTGFGLIGHLLEMLVANDTNLSSQSDGDRDRDLPSIRAMLHMNNIPLYRGGVAASKNRIYSSLQKQNERNRRAVCNHNATATTYPIEYPLLFDPQTAGGLLFFVDPKYSRDFVSYLKKEGNVSQVSVIGEVEAYSAAVTNEDTDTAMIPSMVSEACIIGNHPGRASTENRIHID